MYIHALNFASKFELRKRHFACTSGSRPEEADGGGGRGGDPTVGHFFTPVLVVFSGGFRLSAGKHSASDEDH